MSSNPERLLEDLRKLVTRPKLRNELKIAGRKYAEKYHSFKAMQFLFKNVIAYLDGEKKTLSNLYHPLTGEYRSGEPKLTSPLFENRIIE